MSTTQLYCGDQMSWRLSLCLILPVSPVFWGVFLMVFNHGVLLVCLVILCVSEIVFLKFFARNM